MRAYFNQMTSQQKQFLLLLVALSVGLAARLTLSLLLPSKPIWPDSHYYLENAKNILAGSEYDPTYYRGPLYSYFIAFLFTFLPNKIITIRLAQAFLWIVIIIVLHFITGYLLLDVKIQLVQTFLLSVHPWLIYISSVTLSETVFILLYILMLATLYCYIENNRLAYIFLSGLFLGLACITRSNAFIFFPGLLLYLLITLRRKIWRSIFPVGAFFLAFLIIIAPYLNKLHNNLDTWTLHGYGTRFLWLYTVHPLYGPIDNVIERDKDMTPLQKQKVLKYTPEIRKDHDFETRNRLFKEALLRYIKENPTEYLCKFLGKFFNNFRFYPNTNSKIRKTIPPFILYPAYFFLSISYLLFFLGLYFMRDKYYVFFPILYIIASSILIFTVHHSRIRFTVSILPLMLIFSSYALVYLVTRVRMSS